MAVSPKVPTARSAGPGFRGHCCVLLEVLMQREADRETRKLAGTCPATAAAEDLHHLRGWRSYSRHGGWAKAGHSDAVSVGVVLAHCIFLVVSCNTARLWGKEVGPSVFYQGRVSGDGSDVPRV